MILAVALVVPAAGQGYPDLIKSSYNADAYEFIAAVRSVDTDGSITWSMPDLHLIAPLVGEWTKDQIDHFHENFGSIQEHGLVEGSAPPDSFCPPPNELLLHPPRSKVGGFDGTLLLSEVAVAATVADIIPGFSASGHPMALLALSEVVTLTRRSPVPEYALLRLKRLVIAGSVFCDTNVGFSFDYEPRLETRVVLIGTWNHGVVPIGPQATGGLIEVQTDSSLNPIFMAGGNQAETLNGLTAYIDQFEDKGFFEATKFIARDLSSKQRRAISEAVHSDDVSCSLVSLRLTDAGRWIADRECQKPEP
ncbi:MAG: hypothetical protein OXG74_08615 [Acidobacteria bacterium]|nr:hypothetical protein [Acidobacteriota bacterium]